MTTKTKATITKLTKHRGVAGQIGVSVVVHYPGDDSFTITFAGSVYGGPVVMMTPGAPQGVFVTDPGRFGEFGEQWVRNFFEEA